MRPGRKTILLVSVAIAFAALGFLVSSLLTNIFERKQEAKNPYVRLVEVTEATTDAAPWGINWAREYDGYRRTNEVTRTKYGGSEALPAEKIERDPWLKRMFNGYAFAIDYRDLLNSASPERLAVEFFEAFQAAKGTN